MNSKFFLCFFLLFSINSYGQNNKPSLEQYAACYANFMLIAGTIQRDEPNEAAEAKGIARKFYNLVDGKLDDKKFDLILNQEASSYKKLNDLKDGSFVSVMRKKLDNCRSYLK